MQPLTRIALIFSCVLSATQSTRAVDPTELADFLIRQNEASIAKFQRLRYHVHDVQPGLTDKAGRYLESDADVVIDGKRTWIHRQSLTMDSRTRIYGPFECTYVRNEAYCAYWDRSSPNAHQF